MKNVVLVGCGNIARSHAKKLKGRVKLGFQSRNTKSAESCKKTFGGDVFSSYEDVLADPSVEAVFICSPPEFHRDQVVDAIAAKKFVFVEKPLCLSPKELSEIEEAIEDENRFMVAENYYYKPSLLKLKAWMQRESFGELRSIKIAKNFQQGSVNWKGRLGALIEGGIHFVAFLSGLVDEKPTSVQASFPKLKDDSVAERTSIVNLSYPNNVVAELQYSWETPSLPAGLLQHSLIEGTKGKIVFESNGLYLQRYGEKRGLSLPKLKDVAGSQGMIDDFIDVLEGRKERAVSDFAKAKRDLEIVFAAYSSSDRLNSFGAL